MLTPKAREMIRSLCASLDRKALEETMQIVKSYHDSKIRKELQVWRKGQKVEVRTSPSEHLHGVIVSVNQRSLTIDLGRRKIRALPSSVRLVRE